MSCQGCERRTAIPNCHTSNCPDWAQQLAEAEQRRRDRMMRREMFLDSKIKYGADATRKRNGHEMMGRML